MPKANVFNMAGQQVGEIELSEAVFGIEPNEAVVHEVVKNHLANCRQGTQSALTRAEVSGGGKKPWRQKGTGHARQGSIRAPPILRKHPVVGIPTRRRYIEVIDFRELQVRVDSGFAILFLSQSLV